MCAGKEDTRILTSSLNEDYLAGSVASFMACKKYDETITVINTSKGYVSYREQNLQQQLVKNNTGEKRILVVDDEYDTNLTLKVVLEESGFKVDSFTDPLVALRDFKSGLYDLALIDVKMPGMHGFGLSNEIRKFDIKVKICFLTALKIPIMNLLGSKHILTMKKIASFGSRSKMNY